MFLFDKETKDKSGVYAIINKVNSKLYVGSASCFYNRLHAHYSELINNKHSNSYLQNSWNEYGEESFDFEIIELVDIINDNKDNLIEREQYWLDYHQSYIRDKGYNLQPCSKSALGFKHSEETIRKRSIMMTGSGNHNYGKVTPPEVRKKISEGNKGKMLGIKFTEDHKRKISKSLRKKYSKARRDNIGRGRTGKCLGEENPFSKLTNEIVLEIREKYAKGDTSHKKLAKEYNIGKTTVSHIVKRESWKHI